MEAVNHVVSVVSRITTPKCGPGVTFNSGRLLLEPRLECLNQHTCIGDRRCLQRTFEDRINATQGKSHWRQEAPTLSVESQALGAGVRRGNRLGFAMSRSHPFVLALDAPVTDGLVPVDLGALFAMRSRSTL